MTACVYHSKKSIVRFPIRNVLRSIIWLAFVVIGFWPFSASHASPARSGTRAAHADTSRVEPSAHGEIEVTRRIVAADFQWPDAIDVADLNGDGKLDFVTGGGHPGTIYTVRIFFQQESIHGWREQVIFEGHGRIQGAAVFIDPRTKRPIIFSADQLNGQIRLHVSPERRWTAATSAPVVSGRPWIQSLVALDLDRDGVDELVYAWEGVGAKSGGVNALRLIKDADPALPASWQDVSLTQLEGAWALRDPVLRDYDRDGKANELLVGARRALNGTRNPAAKPGLYYLKVTSLDTEAQLTKIGDAGLDPINFARGSFFGRGSQDDVAMVDLQSDVLTFMETGSGRARFELKLPRPPEPSLDSILVGWNVTTIPRKSRTQKRDALIVVAARSTGNPSQVFGLYWDGASYRFQLFETWPYGHPADNRMIWVDLDRDGILDLIAPDSGGNQVLIYNFRLK